jgi:hypothetical protein
MDPARTPAEQTSGNPQGHDNAGTEGIKTLGVLFVHGVGTQRRGDTLAQCGGAIHDWLRHWLTQPTIEGGSLFVDLLDTSLAQPNADEPAHSRLIFRKEAAVAHKSWLFAESCWAETFRAPSYPEFVRWALRVLPLAALLHLLATFRRDLSVMRIAGKCLKQQTVSFEELGQLQSVLGPRHGLLPTQWPALRTFLVDQNFRAGVRWFLTPFVLVPMLVVALLMQALLFAVMIIEILPVGFLRSLASRVQKMMAAVLGDSYLFVASPISASAAATQVKKDVQWLAARCDQVVIVAHSQGAAVAYRALQEWTWEGRAPQNLKHLITYGSGLQKLFDLQQLSQERTPADARALRKGLARIALGSVGVLSVAVWLFGAMPLWPFALSLAAGFYFLMVGLFVTDNILSQGAPAVPLNIGWLDFFASRDPVSNGSITVAPPVLAPTGSPAYDDLLRRVSKGLVDVFHMQQREVVNLQSSIADHTTYWSAMDDFVSRVVTQLLRVSEIPSPATPDTEWCDISVQRRRWRVGLRTGCRKVAIFAVLCTMFWPREIMQALGLRLIDSFSWVAVSLPETWTPGWMAGIAIPASLLAIGLLLICILGTLCVAMAGWKAWERREIAHFFRREPYRSEGGGLFVFALGWLGILVVPPLAAAYFVGERALWPWVWTLSFLLALSCWTLVRSGAGPGRLSEWIATLLQRGEWLLEQKTDDRLKTLSDAGGYFKWAVRWLLDEKDSMQRVRALLGTARVLEETGVADANDHAQIKVFYNEALASLERMGEDTRAVRERLDKLTNAATSTAVK